MEVRVVIDRDLMDLNWCFCGQPIQKRKESLSKWLMFVQLEHNVYPIKIKDGFGVVSQYLSDFYAHMLNTTKIKICSVLNR